MVPVRRRPDGLHLLAGQPGHDLIVHHLGRDHDGVAAGGRHTVEQPAEMVDAGDVETSVVELLLGQCSALHQPVGECRVGRSLGEVDPTALEVDANRNVTDQDQLTGELLLSGGVEHHPPGAGHESAEPQRVG